jgi:hypothetical protein
MFFRFFTLCSARVSALMTVLSDSPVTESENGRISQNTRIMGKQHRRRGTTSENQH